MSYIWFCTYRIDLVVTIPALEQGREEPGQHWEGGGEKNWRCQAALLAALYGYRAPCIAWLCSAS